MVIEEVMSMDRRPIGVFDSGLGGLTAVRRLRRLLPGEELLFLGDTARVPYGGKDADTILRYAKEDFDFLARRGVKAVLAACGTVSSLALPAIEGRGLPVCGVVLPAARAAARAARAGRIAVIGTEAALRSGAYVRAIGEFKSGAEVLAVPCPRFVPLIEGGHTERDDPLLRAAVAETLAPIKAFDPEVLLLGCTHYPLIAPALGGFLGPGVTLVDSAAAAAEELGETLSALGLLSPEKKGKLTCHITGSPGRFAALAGRFLTGPETLSVTHSPWEETGESP